MMRLVSVAALLALTACQSPAMLAAPAPAPAPLGDPKSRLIAAVEAEGCVITAENANRIQAAAAIDEAQLTAISEELIADGLIELAGPQSVRFRTENCS
jgi:hypothetical protein